MLREYRDAAAVPVVSLPHPLPHLLPIWAIYHDVDV